MRAADRVRRLSVGSPCTRENTKGRKKDVVVVAKDTAVSNPLPSSRRLRNSEATMSLLFRSGFRHRALRGLRAVGGEISVPDTFKALESA